MFALFEDLIEMRMQGFRDFLVFTLVVILGAEFKAFLGSLVVKVEHLRILT